MLQADELEEQRRSGDLPGEQVEIDNYERVGHMLSLMKSKARLSLKDKQDNGTPRVH